MYPREMKTYIHTKPVTKFIALLIVSKHWKQPQSPLAGEQSNWSPSPRDTAQQWEATKDTQAPEERPENDTERKSQSQRSCTV